MSTNIYLTDEEVDEQDVATNCVLSYIILKPNMKY